MGSPVFVGVDLGGTQVRAGRANLDALELLHAMNIDAKANAEAVFGEVCHAIEQVLTPDVRGIGIGVPGLVRNGVVYDVVNIASWKKIPLQEWLENRFRLPVTVNNDANCFALGEWNYGSAKGSDHMIGLTIGTGMGAGVVLKGELYEGPNGGAGEFGMMPYLGHNYEYFTSGQFFPRMLAMDGKKASALAKEKDLKACAAFDEFGTHLGQAILAIAYAYDIRLVIIGGSVSRSFEHFEQSLMRTLDRFAFQTQGGPIRVLPSRLENAGVLGAATLPQLPTAEKTEIST